MAHQPVMVAEVLKFLNPQPGENFVDCTLGDGGHTSEILQLTAPSGKILAFDLDPEAIINAKKNLAGLASRTTAINKNFSELEEVAKIEKFGGIKGVLMDFGFSSAQIEERGRGFSFKKDEPLDMRFSGGLSIGGGQELTAAEIVNSWPRSEIARIIAEYGEDRLAEQIAQAIVAARRKKRLLTTFSLVDVVRQAVPGNYENGRIHPATRTFQALRIAVNDELGSIERVLPQSLSVLAGEGVIVAIAFHSLEDRLVKRFMKDQEAKGQIEILTVKPVIATDQEVANNPRARSAKLRAARKK